MREEFEKAFPVPTEIYWSVIASCYNCSFAAHIETALRHTRMLEAWQAATALQAERVRELERLLEMALSDLEAYDPRKKLKIANG
jgi:hypothetical protein